MLPLSGYLASNFSKHGIKFFNLVRWPPWGPDDKTCMRSSTRPTTCRAAAGLFVGLHVLAVPSTC
jgi:cytochrome b561